MTTLRSMTRYDYVRWRGQQAEQAKESKVPLEIRTMAPGSIWNVLVREPHATYRKDPDVQAWLDAIPCKEPE